MGVQADHRPGTELLAGRTVAYVLSGYPVLSQTFVRDEVATMRAAGVDVDVTAVAGGDGDRIPLAWSGPFRDATHVSPLAALRDGLWWLARPRAVLRLLRVFLAGGRASPKSLALGVPTIARRLAGRDVQVLHTHFGWRAMMPTVYVGALLGRPVSVTLHAADIYLAPPSFARRLSTVDQVVTVCDYNVDRIAALGVPRERIAVVPCGVDVDVPVVPIADPLLVVSVGRLVAKKGYDVLLPAFREVVDRVPGARLEIVGEGPEQDAVHALATELGLDDHVTFLGARPHAESLARIADAAVFTLACRISENGDSDAMPVSLREAMVRARPVVTTAVAGIPENVDDEVGWVVPPGDVDALADALVEALTDRSEAERRALAARRRQVAHYSLERSAATLATLWAHVVGRRS